MAKTIWTATLARKYAAALDQIERALRDCPDELWEASLWEVKRTHHAVWPVRRIDDKPSRAASREPLLQVYSAFWNVAYHAIFHVDFYLSGGMLKGFAPPAPFREEEHRAHVIPNRAYTRAELQAYVAYNRRKVQTTIESLTEDQAKRILPRTGQPFADLLFGNVVHTQEHAAQLNLFLSQHGIEPQGGIAAEQGRQFLRDGVRGRTDAEIDTFVKSAFGYARLLPLVFAGFAASIRPRESCVVRFDVGSSYVIRVTPEKATVETTMPDKA